jgi:MFS transporter, ACS family, hexuronate transporter
MAVDESVSYSESGNPTLKPNPALAVITKYRWVVCALLFVATTINYLDRVILSILGPNLMKEFGWTDSDYGDLNSAFQFAYAFGFLVSGYILDRLGTKRGFAVSIVIWSAAAVGHAFARSLAGFQLARIFLGIGESGNFPASIKTVAEWFPKKERALATGIFNAGSNVGATIAPLLIPILYLYFGWIGAFIITGMTGFFWLILWLILYEKPELHKRVSAGELAYIRSDGEEKVTRVRWINCFPHRQTWAFAIGKALTDPIWWFYLVWIPRYLNKQFGLDIVQFGPPLVFIYLAADFGSVMGGGLSSYLIKKGKTVNIARKTAMLVCALCVVPIFAASHSANLYIAVGLIGLAAAAHQGWSANIFTLVSDTFPKSAVGSVVGIGGLCGALAGAGFQMFVGRYVDRTGNFALPFVIASGAYLVALLVIHLLAPRLDKAQMTEA